ncbi:lactate permease [Edaphobacter acidisoli]|uniref:L-lactate permease n=1 Tax=Edaphobacter acidisoli TaxID=2040573 RepID=A0A916W194_9BACT|nr:lactate permease LctP family transporter [Edaphobacter acidisoli]GGA57843.1 lactate permease [Edaphobacter acidisoli]
MTSPWPQPYYLFGRGLAFSAFLAILPTLLLLFLLAVKRKASWIAALAGLAATIVLAIGAYGMSWQHTFSAAAYGAAFGLFPITWVIYWALVLYQITVRTAKFEVIKDSIGAITSDARLQALLIAFAFGAFLEGCAGFGTPVAVAAAMMVGLGFAPLYASSLCLLANTAPVAFGSIGIPILTLAAVTGLSMNHLSADIGMICAPISFFLPAYLILVTSGRAAVRAVWPAVLVCGASFALVQFSVSRSIGPQLTDVLSSLAAMAALILLLRRWQPTQIESIHPATSTTPRTHTAREIWSAWMPYALLVVFVLAWGIGPVQSLLSKATTAFAWPGLHNEILRQPPVARTPALYAAIFNGNWLSAAGTACMFASLFSALAARMKLRAFLEECGTVVRILIYPTITVTAMLAMAFVMNYSGATGTLGLAFAATGSAVPFFSSITGWLGVFLTGSDTASNALFGNLQVVSATRLQLDPTLMAAANSAGGVMGKMISLQSIAVAAAATGMSVPEQAKLFRFTLRHSILLASIVGLEVLLYAHILHHVR